MRGHIRKRGNKWAAVVYLGRDAGGRKRYEWRSCTTATEAELWLAQRVALQHNGNYMPHPARTIAAFLEEWLLQHRAGWSLRTYLGYRDIVRLHIVPRIGALPLAKLTAARLQELYRDRAAAGLRQQTVHHIHGVLHKVLADAVAIGAVMYNPADRVPVAQTRGERRGMTIWDEEQIRLFLAAARRGRSRYALLYETALMTGMRKGELVALRWGDVDWIRGIIQVVRTGGVVAGHGFVVRHPKTRHARRAIAIGRELLRKLHRQRVLAGAGSVDTWIFARRDVPIGLTQLRNDLRDTADQAGVPRIRFHDFRHTHATQLLMLGVPIKIVQERLGHSSPAFTLDYYAHVLPTLQRDAAQLIERRILGRSTRPPAWLADQVKSGRSDAEQQSGRGQVPERGSDRRAGP